MIKHSLVFLSLIFAVHFSYSQKVLVNVFMQDKITRAGSDTIYYNSSRQLTWNDFQGVPDEHHFGGAITSSGYAFDADIKIEGKVIYLNIGVYTFFSKHNSWKKPGIISDYHLLHEQHHFDITRISAENFINAVAKARFTKDNYNKLMGDLFDKSYNECNRFQQQYDNETQHSINRDEQFKWNDRIEAMVRKITN